MPLSTRSWRLARNGSRRGEPTTTSVSGATVTNPLAPAASTLDSLLPIVPAVNVRLEAMPVHDRTRVRAAAFRATRVYPGPVGNLICKELQAWEEIGFRLGAHGPIMSLVDHVEKAALPVSAQPLAEQILASESQSTDTTTPTSLVGSS